MNEKSNPFNNEKGKNFIIKYLPLILILFLASIINFFLFSRNFNLGGDGIGYLFPIHNFFRGNGYTIDGKTHLFMPPGYGILSYIIYSIIQFFPINPSIMIPLSGMLASSISYLLSIILAFIISKKLFNIKAAYLSSFFIAFNYSLIELSFVTLSESCFILFLLLSFYCLIKIFKRNNNEKTITLILTYFIFGLILGFSYLIRSEAFLIFLICIPFLILEMIMNKRAIIKSLVFIFIFIIGFFCMAFPYMLFLYENIGHWTVSTKISMVLIVYGEKVVEGSEHVYFLMENHPEYWDLSYQVDIFEYIMQRGDKFILRMLININNELRTTASLLYVGGIIFVIYNLINTCLMFNRDKRFKFRISKDGVILTLLFLVPIIPFFSYIIFYIYSRLILPYIIILIIYMSKGVIDFVEKSFNWIKTRKIYLSIKKSIHNILSKTFLVREKKLRVFKPFIRKITNFPIKFLNKNKINIPNICIMFISTSLFLYSVSNFYASLTYQHGHGALIESGFWLEENYEDIDNTNFLFVRKGVVALFFAGGYKGEWGQTSNIPPDLTLKDISQYMKNEKIDLLILENFYISNRQKLLHLWKDPTISTTIGLKLIYQKPGVFQVYASL